jgi:hypothetical protein
MAQRPRHIRSCTDNELCLYYARLPYCLAPKDNSLPRLTDQGSRKISDLARHYGVSVDAVMTLLQALVNDKGTMAQIDHRELGGVGQWMPGGMTMVGDMFNHGLKAKIDGLCSELSRFLAVQPFVPSAAFQSQPERQGGGQQEGGHDVMDTGSVSLFVPDRGRTINALAMSCLRCTKHGSSFDLGPAIPWHNAGSYRFNRI